MSNNIGDDIRDALQNRDPTKFIAAINMCLSHCCYSNVEKGDRDKFFYCNMMSAIFFGINADYNQQKAVGLSTVDFVVRSKEHTWVIQLKVARHNDDAKRAAEAMRQIIEKELARAVVNPVLLGIAINDKDQTIKHWECRGGLAERPMAPSGSADDGETPMAPRP